jgi:hypothetical protein
MSMYAHTRTHAQRLIDENRFRAAVLVHGEHLASHVLDLVAQMIVVLFLCICLAWITSLYSRALFAISLAMFRASARGELQAPRAQFVVMV